MQVESILIKKLIPHPDNANVMDNAQRQKLKQHITGHKCYEPLVVRPHPDQFGAYQLINGHHRKLVLEQLGYTHAHCIVWNLDDDQTLLLLATINRLSGSDDPLRRARLLRQLSRRFDRDRLLQSLPEKKQQYDALLQLHEKIKTLLPGNLPETPQSFTVFVNHSQKKTIDRALQCAGQQVIGDDPDRKLSRGDLLAIIADTYLKTCPENGLREHHEV